MNDLPWYALGILDGAEDRRQGRGGSRCCCLVIAAVVILLIVAGFLVRSSV